MNLYEYEGKRIFAKYGIPIPKGKVAENPDQVRRIAVGAATKVVIKAQVLTGGRGKAGGIKVAEGPEDALLKASHILSLNIKGFPVRKVLVEEVASITKEYYVSFMIDRESKSVVLMGSSEGGMDIEEVAKNSPEKIFKYYINPVEGLRDYIIRDLAGNLFKDQDKFYKQFYSVCKKLYKLLGECDASLVEINPLISSTSCTLTALDSKVIIDDNGLYRQTLTDIISREEPSEVDRLTKGFGLSYVKLNGNIGCIVNGAGLSMSTMDMIKYFGGAPANFLDIGGSSNPNKVINAIKVIMIQKGIKSILINIFGGITRCDDVANGLVQALNELNVKIPVVIRLTGTNQKQGHKILKGAGLEATNSMIDAVKKVVKISM